MLLRNELMTATVPSYLVQVVPEYQRTQNHLLPAQKRTGIPFSRRTLCPGSQPTFYQLTNVTGFQRTLFPVVTIYKDT